MDIAAFLLTWLAAFINTLAFALQIVIFARVLLSWVPARLPLGLGELVWNVSEPILGPIRRALPFTGGLDFSPFVALIAIDLVRRIAVSALQAIVYRGF